MLHRDSQLSSPAFLSACYPQFFLARENDPVPATKAFALIRTQRGGLEKLQGGHLLSDLGKESPDPYPALFLEPGEVLCNIRSWPHPKGSEARPSVSLIILYIEEKLGRTSFCQQLTDSAKGCRVYSMIDTRPLPNVS